MIAFIEGGVRTIGPDGAVIEVGGVGLSVHCTPGTLARLRPGERVHVPTSLVVREESLTLYGFADDDERVVFELLQTASGVGPRLALAMLAVHSPQALRRAVATADLDALTQVPGIGKKGAQRIVLELKDRLGAPDAEPLAEAPAGRVGGPPWREQVHAALTNLGWSTRDADEAVAAVAAHAPEAAEAGEGAPDIPALLRAALKTLSRT